MIYIVNINNKEYEVEVEKGKANLIKTTEVSAPAPAATAAPVETSAKLVSEAPVNIAAGEPIKAPMPGTILDIKVSAGSNVKKGDIILILEAMKMENEIFAPRDGVISQVVISKGSSVATNDILMIIQ